MAKDDFEQDEDGNESNYEAQLAIARSKVAIAASDQDSTQVAMKVANEVKKWRRIWTIIASIVSFLTNPVTLIFLLILLVALVGYWCVDQAVDCIGQLGFGTIWGTLEAVIKAILGVK